MLSEFRLVTTLRSGPVQGRSKHSFALCRPSSLRKSRSCRLLVSRKRFEIHLETIAGSGLLSRLGSLGSGVVQPQWSAKMSKRLSVHERPGGCRLRGPSARGATCDRGVVCTVSVDRSCCSGSERPEP